MTKGVKQPASVWPRTASSSQAAPEDWSGSVDVEATDDQGRGQESSSDDRDMRASPLDGIDLFE